MGWLPWEMLSNESCYGDVAGGAVAMTDAAISERSPWSWCGCRELLRVAHVYGQYCCICLTASRVSSVVTVDLKSKNTTELGFY